MTHMLRLACLVVLLTSPLLASPGAPAYSVVGLEGLTPGFPSRAFAINERTQVVGWSLRVEPFIFDFKAVLWEAGQIRDLGALPGGVESTATGIDNRGQVVLYSEAVNCRSDCSRAALWQKGTMSDLGAIGQSAFPSDINDLGQVVGLSSLGPALGSPRRAVLWDRGALIDLGTLPGDFQSAATAINNRGQIVGSSSNDNDSRPFLWENGVMTEVLGLSWASDINDAGQIVGSVEGTPAIWENGTVTPLALPPGSWSLWDAAMNVRGQVAGTLASATNTDFHIAVVWRNGTPVQLPPLPPSQGGQAFDINDRGEIVGDSAGRAVLWVPRER